MAPGTRTQRNRLPAYPLLHADSGACMARRASRDTDRTEAQPHDSISLGWAEHASLATGHNSVRVDALRSGCRNDSDGERRRIS